MSFLTQASIDYAAAMRLGLLDVYAWHQMAWRSFPGGDAARRDYLTRVDKNEREHRFILHIVSKRPTARPYARPDSPNSWRTREISSDYLSRRQYRFKLRANPVKRSFDSHQMLSLYSAAELREWIKRKAAANGFTLDDGALSFVSEGKRFFTKEKGGQSGFVNSVEYEGILTVVDKAAFVNAFETGIGRSKAFGFGMLVAVPIQ